MDGSGVPNYKMRGRPPRTTGASLLVAPPDPGVCEDGSTTEYVVGRINVCERAYSPPSRSRWSRLRTEAPRYRLLILITATVYRYDRTPSGGRYRNDLR